MAGWQDAPSSVSGWQTAPIVGQGQAAPEQAPMTATGTAKALASGAGQGGIDFLSMPYDLGQWAGKKTVYGIQRMLGYSPEDAQAGADNMLAAQKALAQTGMVTPTGPSGEEMRQGVESVTGPLYQPKNRLEQYAHTTGTFLPSALAGPGSALRKAAMTVIPGLATEGAGQATEGLKIGDYNVEPVARTAAAVISSLLTGGVGVNKPTKAMIKDAPKQAEVMAQKDTLFKKLEGAGVKYDANAYKAWSKNLTDRLATEGLDPTLHPQATAVLKRVLDLNGRSPTFTEMETLRKIAGEAARGGANVSAADLNRSGVILHEIDSFFGGAPLISNGRIPANQVNEVAKKARELSRRNIMARDINEMDRKSEYYLGGSESGQRNQFGSYMRSPKGRMVTDAEKAAFSKVIRREGVENFLHNTGSRAAQIGTLAVGGASAPYTGMLGPMIAGGAVLGNIGARKLMETITNKRVQNALATVLAGKDAQKVALSATAAEKQAALIRALLAANPSLRKLQEQSLPSEGGIYGSAPYGVPATR